MNFPLVDFFIAAYARRGLHCQGFGQFLDLAQVEFAGAEIGKRRHAEEAEETMGSNIDYRHYGQIAGGRRHGAAIADPVNRWLVTRDEPGQRRGGDLTDR
jgi:hypothetical protein